MEQSKVGGEHSGKGCRVQSDLGSSLVGRHCDRHHFLNDVLVGGNILFFVGGKDGPQQVRSELRVHFPGGIVLVRVVVLVNGACNVVENDSKHPLEDVAVAWAWVCDRSTTSTCTRGILADIACTSIVGDNGIAIAASPAPSGSRSLRQLHEGGHEKDRHELGQVHDAIVVMAAAAATFFIYLCGVCIVSLNLSLSAKNAFVGIPSITT
mmetsp:Transcript_207/g.421  ORF Transcript_207/g.421 Transcript_207/m.421 type:complete len:209 (-) Transcript_207:136-762(-)